MWDRWSLFIQRPRVINRSCLLQMSTTLTSYIIRTRQQRSHQACYTLKRIKQKNISENKCIYFVALFLFFVCFIRATVLPCFRNVISLEKPKHTTLSLEKNRWITSRIILVQRASSHTYLCATSVPGLSWLSKKRNCFVVFMAGQSELYHVMCFAYFFVVLCIWKESM